MRKQPIPFSAPLIGQEEIDEVVATLRSGWVTTGPKTRQFEAEFATAVDADAALALNSCTAGLHLALLAHGVGPGDEVITTGWTFASTVNVIEHVGAQPVLVDVEPDTLNIDADRIAAAITDRTKAIIVVHFAGLPVDLKRINALARRHDLKVIEDAAHGIGAAVDGQPIGGGGNLCAFSFYATKNLTTGEGGMLTGPSDLIEQARLYSQHGISRAAWTRQRQDRTACYDVVHPGYKYNLTDIQSSIGLWQLRKLPAAQDRRTQIAAAYDAAFRDLGVFELPARRNDCTHAWHLYVLRILPGRMAIDRDAFLQQLTDRQIGSSVHFIPIPCHSFYRDRYGWDTADFPVMNGAKNRVFSLPLSPKLTHDDVADVIDAVCDIVRSHRVGGAAA